jgi:ligand-binding SRPBCC domain-containing protein
MAIHVLERSQRIERPVEEVFPFYADAGNLDRITPPWLVDAQLGGPYELWHHTHTFRADGEGATILGDRVHYAIPFGPLGEAARSLFVERDLERIFDQRRDAVAEAFS